MQISVEISLCKEEEVLAQISIIHYLDICWLYQKPRNIVPFPERLNRHQTSSQHSDIKSHSGAPVCLSVGLFLFFFCPSCLCSSQLTLCEDDRLRMKLEFQKCLSVMDRCLVLPHALSRTKLYSATATWRKESEQHMVNR